MSNLNFPGAGGQYPRGFNRPGAGEPPAPPHHVLDPLGQGALPVDTSRYGASDLIPGGRLDPHNRGGMLAGPNMFLPSNEPGVPGFGGQLPQRGNSMADHFARFDPLMPGRPGPGAAGQFPPGSAAPPFRDGNVPQRIHQMFPGEPDPDHLQPFLPNAQDPFK